MRKNALKILLVLLMAFNFNFVSALESDQEMHILDSTQETEENTSDYVNKNNNYRVIIDDKANLLSESEKNNLLEKMQPLTEYGNIGFVSVSENYMSTASYASDYYHNTFGTASGTIFLIDMDNRNIYIFSDGSNYNVITNGVANIITDNIYKLASQEKYYDCASKAFTQIGTLLDGGKVSEPMRYIINALISIILAFFLGFIFILKSSKLKKAKANEMLKNSIVDFKMGEMSALRVGGHRVYNPPSSSSSGGSSGGGGGGGSSGGGGGHSF